VFAPVAKINDFKNHAEAFSRRLSDPPGHGGPKSGKNCTIFSPRLESASIAPLDKGERANRSQ